MIRGHALNTDLASTDASHPATRLHVAALVLGVLVLSTFYFVRPASLLAMPILIVLVPIVVVTTQWLGLRRHASQPTTLRARAASFLTFVVAAMAGPMITREPDEWLPIVPIIAAVTITGFIVYAIYASRIKPYATDGSVSRLSADGIRAHFTGYIVGLAAGIGAATLVRVYGPLADMWLWSAVAYGIAFAVGKLAADLLSPTPAPYRQPTMSSALLRMTALSPLWWGLPWGIAYAGYTAVTLNAMNIGLRFLMMDGLSSVLHVATAVTLVFAALTILVYVQEVIFEPRREPQEPPSEALASGDWARLFWGVVFLSLAAGVFVYRPLGPSDRELFGTETWKCARDGDEYKLGWIARDGVHITNLRGGFDFFNMSCVPRAGSRGGCKYDKENWDEAMFVIRGSNATRTITFSRRDPDVQYGGLYGKSALTLLDALYEGSSADMTVKAPKGRVLYTLHIDLKGFRPELDTCIAHWNSTKPPKR